MRKALVAVGLAAAFLLGTLGGGAANADTIPADCKIVKVVISPGTKGGIFKTVYCADGRKFVFLTGGPLSGRVPFRERENPFWNFGPRWHSIDANFDQALSEGFGQRDWTRCAWRDGANVDVIQCRGGYHLKVHGSIQ